MKKENSVMWFGFIGGGLMLLLFSAMGLSQFYIGVKSRLQPKNKDSEKDRSSK